MSETKKRVLSGVQPTGDAHLGNYLGAISQWARNQDVYENLFCVVDLHALTIPEAVDPAALRAKTLEVAALYLACGIDPARSTIFIQSEVRAHVELNWILTCVTPLGWLHRMTQFKSKSEDREAVGSGLLCYPVLQAADILVYNADLVPIGADQKQHIELARDIAERFNHLFGQTLKPPAAMIPKAGARIMGLDTPLDKMSKSAPGKHHAIGLLQPLKQVKKSIMKAVTGTEIEYRLEHASPGVVNLLNIWSALTGDTPEAIGERYAGQGFGYLKKDLADVVCAALEPIQAEYHKLMDEQGYLQQVLTTGAEQAAAIAEPIVARAREAVGLGRA